MYLIAGASYQADLLPKHCCLLSVISTTMIINKQDKRTSVLDCGATNTHQDVSCLKWLFWGCLSMEALQQRGETENKETKEPNRWENISSSEDGSASFLTEIRELMPWHSETCVLKPFSTLPVVVTILFIELRTGMGIIQSAVKNIYIIKFMELNLGNTT